MNLLSHVFIFIYFPVQNDTRSKYHQKGGCDQTNVPHTLESIQAHFYIPSLPSDTQIISALGKVTERPYVAQNQR